jgi:hypothetical protein
MKITSLFISLAVLALINCLSAADDAAQWKVQVAGISVGAPAPEGKDNSYASSWSAGSTVLLVVTAPSGNIVNINTDASKLEAFTDDKGTDLLAVKSQSHFHDSCFSVSSLLPGEEKHAAKPVSVRAPGVPAKGATQFNISGKLVVQTASQTKQSTADNVELKTGSKFDLADIPMTVSNIFSDMEGMGVSLSAKQDLSNISKLEFFDALGNKIEAHAYGSSFMTKKGKKEEETQDYRLKKSVSKVKIVATCWTDLKTTEVPIAIKTGLGL